jgi:hypothetical protein
VLYRRRRFLASAVAAGAVLALPRRLWAQEPSGDGIPPGYGEPDQYGEVWVSDFEYDGTQVYCPIPQSLRRRNEGGSDNAGLCVIASNVTDWRWQKITEEAEAIWRTAKQRKGGYWPERFAALVLEVAPELAKVAKSVEEDNLDWLAEQTAQGIACGQTFGVSRAYRDAGYNFVPHMISGVHCDSVKWAGIDNNYPDAIIFLPRKRAEYAFRLQPDLSLGYGWGTYLDLPGSAPKPNPEPKPNPDAPDAPSGGGGGPIEGALLALAGVGVGAAAVRLACGCPGRGQ